MRAGWPAATKWAVINLSQQILHHFCGVQVLNEGHQHQLAVHQLRLLERFFGNGVAEKYALQIHIDDFCQMRLFDLVVQPRLGSIVRQLTHSAHFYAISRAALPIELASPSLCLRLQCRNALIRRHADQGFAARRRGPSA